MSSSEPEVIETESGRASAHYNDLYGTSAADESSSGQGGLFGLARLLNAKGFPIGMNYYMRMSGGSPFVHVSLYTLADSYGTVADIDKAAKLVAESGGKPLVRKFTNMAMPLHEFVALFKELDISMAPKRLSVEQYNIVEKHQLGDA